MLFVRGVGIAVLALGLGAGCAGEELAGLPETRYQPLASIRVTPGAVALAVGATQQLTVLALDKTGAPITGVAAPKYDTGGDPRVQIDANGLVHAIEPGTDIWVRVSLQNKDVTYYDELFITVTPTVSEAASLTITPDPVTLEPGQTQGLTATARTSPSSGAMEIFGLGQADYVSSNPRVATFAYGSIGAVAPGQATIIGQMTIDGTNFADTITVTVTNPSSATVYMYPSDDASHRITFRPPLVQIAVGGMVTWQNLSETGGLAAQNMDVTFDNPGAVTGGNIPAFTSGSQSRTFPTAGTYTYRSTTNGATGTVIVQ